MSRLALIPLALLSIAAAPHSGEVVRDGFELADAVMFAVVVAGVLVARRALRARFARKRD